VSASWLTKKKKENTGKLFTDPAASEAVVRELADRFKFVDRFKVAATETEEEVACSVQSQLTAQL
jgi:hypothetical protein